jgi:hypothetical protein
MTCTRPGKFPPGQLRRLYDLAIEQGWTVERNRKGNHWRWTPPGGRPVWTQSTPCRGRGDWNAIAKLRRAGLVIPR